MSSTLFCAALSFLGLLAADGCAAAPAGASTVKWYKPTPSDTLLWSIGQIIPANPKDSRGKLLNQNIYGVDLFDVTKEQIAQYHKIGKKVSCYFSAGTFEERRPDVKDFLPKCYCNKKDTCKMAEWDEWWLDLSSPACITNVNSVMGKRLSLAKSKNCDLVEPDNLDSYDNESGWKTTQQQQFNYLSFLSATAHTNGLGIALKNSPRMIAEKPAIVGMYDFAIIEECQAYNECASYQPFVNASKPAFDFEYERPIKCTLPGFSVTSYSSYDVNYPNIVDFCRIPAK